MRLEMPARGENLQEGCILEDPSCSFSIMSLENVLSP